MKNAFQYSHRAFGFSILTAEEAAVDCHGASASCHILLCRHYLKIIRSMGVGPCEWSEVKTNAATKEGFLMNTLRRISRPLVKDICVGAVMVAAALPAMAITGTASAATTAPTIVCTNATHSLVRRARMATPSLAKDSQAISF